MQSMVIRRYWQRRMILGINLGGLAAGVFLLTRTEFPFVPETPWSSVSDSSKTSDKPAEQSTPNSKQMSAERMAAIRMAQDLTNRPWKKPTQSASSENKKENKKTYLIQRPQADYRVEENNMRTKPTSNDQPASAGDDDITELKSSSEAVCGADKELMASNSEPATETEVEKP